MNEFFETVGFVFCYLTVVFFIADMLVNLQDTMLERRKVKKIKRAELNREV